jgi:hypothetical protein
LSPKQVVDVAVPVIVFLTMTAVGLDLAAADFHRVREHESGRFRRFGRKARL